MHRESVTGHNIKLSARIFGKAQLHAISCRVFTEKLRDSHGGYLACRKRYIVPLQVSFHFLALRAGKRHVIESGCYVRKAFFVQPCLAQVENALIGHMDSVGIGWLLFEIGKSVIPLRHCFSAIQRFRRGFSLTPISGRSRLLHS